MTTIVLNKSARCFMRAAAPPCSILAWTKEIILPGRRIEVGDPVAMVFDHQDKVALPFRNGKEECFLLQEEVEPQALTNL